MPKANEKNARIKRVYFRYLREAMRRDEKSIDVVARALARFEEATRHKDFATFNQEQAVAFKRRLADQVSKATAHTTLAALKAFFHWLAGRTGVPQFLRAGSRWRCAASSSPPCRGGTVPSRAPSHPTSRNNAALQH